MLDCSALSIQDLGHCVRQGRLTFAEILDQCLEREQATRDLNAFTEVFTRDAKALAGAYQTMLVHGCDLGPLHGMPLGLKANIAVAGRKMTAGSLILADNVADHDAAVVRRLKRAGANLVGLTNMHEFAWGGTTANPHYGQCRNPWDPGRIPAGSSGGSGVAVAVGSALATLGTDTGGSVRLPASMNGVTGLRPGVGRISTEGVFPLAWTMDTVGPLARTSEDCALIFAALAGLDSDGVMASLARPLAGHRIGILVDDHRGLQPGVAAAFEESLCGFERLGAVLRSVAVEGLEVAVDAQVIVDACEPSAIHEDWLDQRAALYGEDVRILLQAGLSFTASEYLHAQRYRMFLRRQFDALFETVDTILTPTLPFTAPRIGEEFVVIGDREESTLTGNMRFTCIPSLTACPAISFPIGVDTSDLPVGAQLMGPADKETMLLGVVHQFQCGTEHHRRRPPGLP